MTVNGYRDVRCWQRHSAELPGQCSPAVNHQAARELARGIQGKPRGKGVVNLVNIDKRKVVVTLEPKWYAAWWRCFYLTALSSFEQPGDNAFLKIPLNVGEWERGKPVVPRHGAGGIQTVRNGEGTAGRGRRRKRMPFCNEMDRTGMYCDKFVRRESGQTSGGCRRRRRPKVIITAGDVR